MIRALVLLLWGCLAVCNICLTLPCIGCSSTACLLYVRVVSSAVWHEMVCIWGFEYVAWVLCETQPRKGQSKNQCFTDRRVVLFCNYLLMLCKTRYILFQRETDDYIIWKTEQHRCWRHWWRHPGRPDLENFQWPVLSYAGIK